MEKIPAIQVLKFGFVLNKIYGIISKNATNSYLQQTASPAKNIPKQRAEIFFLSANCVKANIETKHANRP